MKMLLENSKTIREVVKKYEPLKKLTFRIFSNIDPLLFDVYPDQAPQNFDRHQAKAWASPYKRNLIFAGAGAGKTKVAVERGKLLISKGVKPERLLFITFTVKAVSQLKEKLGDGVKSEKSPSIMTIHEFSRSCYRQIDEDIDQIYGEEVWEPEFKAWEKAVSSLLKSQPDLEEKFYEWLQIRWIDPSEINLDFLYKSPDHYSEPNIPTQSGIKVRSKAEKDIADFLTANDLDFEYEKPVLFCDFPFRPDFFLTEVGSYVEYLGLMEAANPVVRAEYKKMCEKKRAQFEIHGNEDWANIYIEPDHYRSGEYRAMILNKVNKLRSYTKRVKHKFREERTAEKVKRKMAEKRTHIIYFLKDVADCQKVNQVGTKAAKSGSPYLFHELLDLVEKVSFDTEELLRVDGKMTANRMMEELGKRFDANEKFFKSISEKYDYVFLDEFQDVTPILFRFLKPFLKALPFFAIGDDRQSIYGFAGGTPYFIRNLKKEIKGTKSKALLFNYRSNRTIVQTSNLFTAFGSIKTMAKSEAESTIYLLKVEDEAKQADQVIKFIKEKVGDKKLMVVSRYTPKIDPVVKAYCGELEKGKQEWMTIHKSKGLEREAVLVVGLTEGKDSEGKDLKFSFPASDKDHPIIRCIKKRSLQDDVLSEEMRLFYVALSRAMDHLFVVTVLGKESRFIETILAKQPRVEVVQLS